MITLRFGAAVAASLLLSVPAFAQATAPTVQDHGNPTTGSSNKAMPSMSNAVTPGATAMKGGGSTMPGTCQGMMDKAMPMMNGMSGAKRTMAMKEMDMAKMAMTKKDEASCMAHMKTAMNGMM